MGVGSGAFRRGGYKHDTWGAASQMLTAAAGLAKTSLEGPLDPWN